MLKADLHLHAKEDTHDIISYSAKSLIDKAAELKFDVLSFTFHDKMFYNEIKDYAEKKGILLIPAMEKTIEGKHTLLYNFKQSELDEIKHFEDIKFFKKKNNLVISPHPFFKKSTCMGRKLFHYDHIFDGVEFTFLYNNLMNFNKKAVKFSKKFNKPILANSDLHFFEMFGNSYTLIDSEKNVDAVIKAIKNNKIKMHTVPMSFFNIIQVLLKHQIISLMEILKK